MHFERHFAFQNATNYIFSRKPGKILGFTSKSRWGRVTLNTGIVLFGLINELISSNLTGCWKTVLYFDELSTTNMNVLSPLLMHRPPVKRA